MKTVSGEEEENVHLYLLRACDRERDRVEVVWGELRNVILYFLHRPLFVNMYKRTAQQLSIMADIRRDCRKKISFTFSRQAEWRDLDMQGEITNLKIVCV
jgi:hypothetical protein